MNDYTDKNIENQDDLKFKSTTKEDAQNIKESYDKSRYNDKKRIQEAKEEARTATLQLAQEYEKTQGDVGINSVVQKLNKIAIPFMVFSVMFSTYSFQMDLEGSLVGKVSDPFVVSLIMGFAIGLLLEFLKDTMGEGAFSSMEGATKTIHATVFVVILFVIVKSHLGAVLKFEETITRNTVEEISTSSILDPKTAELNNKISEIQESINSSKTTIEAQKENLNSKWYNKADFARSQTRIHEDYIRGYKEDLKALQEQQTTQGNINIAIAKESSKQQGDILLFTFLLFEFMALASLLSKLVVSRNKNKDIADIKDQTNDFISGIQSGLSTSNELFKVLSSKDKMFNTFAKGQVQSQMAQMEAFITNKNLAEAMALNEIINQPQPQMVHPQPITNEPKSRQMGFIQNDNEIVMALYKDGEIKEGDKLTPRSQIINTNSRKESDKLKYIYNELVEGGVIERNGNKGYYAIGSLEDALQAI